MKNSNLEFIVLAYHDLKSYDKKLILKTNYICESVARKLFGIDFKKIKKIGIELIKNREEEILLYNENVLVFQTNFDFFQTNLERLYTDENEVIKVIQRVLERVADEYKLDKESILKVLEQCYNGGYVNSFFGPKVYSKSNEYYARIACHQTSEQINIQVVFYEDSTDKEISRKNIYSKGSSLPEYYNYLGKLKYQKQSNGFIYSSKMGGEINVSIDNVDSNSTGEKKKKRFFRF